MKKSYCCLVGLIAFISSLCLYSCTSDSDEPRGGGADKEKIEMQVAVYPVKTGEAVDRLLPRMIATTDGWTITELYDGNHPRSMIYHICKGDESLSALMMAEGDYLWLMQYDNARNTTQNDAMLVKAESDGSATVLTGVFDSGTNTFGQSGVARIDMSRSVASAGVLQASQYDDGFDDVRELVLERLINPIAEAHEKLGKLDIKSLKPYVSTMKKVVIPVMKLHLYSNNPDKLSEISGDY
ncbi:MAG: hypothetical protein K2O12_02005, partial [Muribaculaceae bacterium]|nr:hypothetical protein [Muribaculaceae bacterium]